MRSKKYSYYYSYVLIILALFVSGYLLFNHYSVVAGKSSGTDFCSIVFGKGCLVAVLSKYSVFLKIPVGGWGLIYILILLCLIVFSQWFASVEPDEFIQIAFWISLAGIMFSLFYISLMIAVPALFCPFCSIFHILNFTLFFLIKKLTNKPFPALIKGLKNTLGIVFMAKPIPTMFNKLKWAAIIFPFILGLVIYQWAFMQGQKITIERLSGYNPLTELEQFESNEIFDIKLSENDPLLGDINAPVTLVVFSDFQCSLCKMFATNFNYLIDSNKEKLNIRFKYFPLSTECNSLMTDDVHPLACEAARAVEAARLQGRFWEFHDSLFALSTLKNEAQLFEVARILNLDIEKFKTDYQSIEIQTKIKDDIQEGIRLKLDGTPSAYLNGRKLNKLSENNINLLVKILN